MLTLGGKKSKPDKLKPTDPADKERKRSRRM
jgi:hypothetical protein